MIMRIVRTGIYWTRTLASFVLIKPDGLVIIINHPTLQTRKLSLRNFTITR